MTSRRMDLAKLKDMATAMPDIELKAVEKNVSTSEVFGGQSLLMLNS